MGNNGMASRGCQGRHIRGMRRPNIVRCEPEPVTLSDHLLKFSYIIIAFVITQPRRLWETLCCGLYNMHISYLFIIFHNYEIISALNCFGYKYASYFCLVSNLKIHVF